MTRNAFFAIVCFQGAIAAPPNWATLTGSVVDPSGNPISGARVLFRASSSAGVGTTPRPLVSSGVTTNSDGTFSVPGLPQGIYSICAYGSRPTDLASCEWGPAVPTISLVEKQTGTVKIVLQQGTLITFVVTDPNQKIRSLDDLHSAGGPGVNFAIGVWVGTRYLRATLVSKNSSLRQYQIAIPKTTTAQMFLDTSLPVSDSSGRAIPTRQIGALLGPSGPSGININLIVP